MSVLASVALLTVLSILINLDRLYGHFGKVTEDSGPYSLWTMWQLALGAVGLAVVPQVLEIFK
jgi:hypothetical protein